MARLTSPLGVTVNVSDEKAARLLAQGFTRPQSAGTTAQEPPKKAAAKATGGGKSTNKK